MRIADTLSIDILNAHGGIGVSIPMPRLFEGCTSNEGQLPIVGRLHCCNDWADVRSRVVKLVRGGCVAVCFLTILENGLVAVWLHYPVLLYTQKATNYD